MSWRQQTDSGGRAPAGPDVKLSVFLASGRASAENTSLPQLTRILSPLSKVRNTSQRDSIDYIIEPESRRSISGELCGPWKTQDTTPRPVTRGRARSDTAPRPVTRGRARSRPRRSECQPAALRLGPSRRGARHRPADSSVCMPVMSGVEPSPGLGGGQVFGVPAEDGELCMTARSAAVAGSVPPVSWPHDAALHLQPRVQICPPSLRLQSRAQICPPSLPPPAAESADLPSLRLQICPSSACSRVQICPPSACSREQIFPPSLRLQPRVQIFPPSACSREQICPPSLRLQTRADLPSLHLQPRADLPSLRLQTRADLPSIHLQPRVQICPPSLPPPAVESADLPFIRMQP